MVDENKGPSITEDNLDETEAQRIRSWIGRTEVGVKETRAKLDSLTDKITDLIETVSPLKSNYDSIAQKLEDKQADDPDFADKLLKDKKFLTDTIRSITSEQINLEKEVASQLNSKKEQAFKKAVEKIDHPLMEDNGDKIESIARSLYEKGYSPNVAATMAVLQVENDNLKSIVTSGSGQGAQSMLGGGKRRVGKQPKIVIPEKFQARMRQDITDGLVADEQEWLNNTSEDLKASWTG